MAIKKIKLRDLKEMKDKEALILRGCGGDLKDWQDGVNLMLTEDEILLDGTKFEDVYGFKNGEEICTMFPFEGVHLDVGKLAMWRLKTYQTFGGTWLSDYIENNIYEIEPQNQEKFKLDCPLIGADAYCIEPGHSLHSGNELVKDSSTAWKELGSAKQKAINLALLYGKPGSGSDLGGTDGQQWIATQLIVWEIVTGCRETSGTFKCADTKFIDGICTGGANPGVKNIYNKISESLAAYSTVPSFANAVSFKIMCENRINLWD